MENKEFKPYIPAEKITPELTVTSVILGILLAIIFGAANAYLGLRVGMTISASIPAAVISMGIIRILMKKNSILENNIVQTIGSAGESLAAGAIFTLPALFLWAKEGVTGSPNILTISLISLIGGILGVVFMVPLRNALIVKEHGVLPYPEGSACAEVLLAAEDGGKNAKTVFAGMGISAIIKFILDGLKFIPGAITIPLKSLKTVFSVQSYPSLLGVGYICGFKISSFLLAGGVLGWLVLIPLIVTFGANTVIYPSTVSISELYAEGGASAIWSSYIRYIGAGAVAAGGIISLIKTLPLIFKTFAASIKSMRNKTEVSLLRTEQDISFKIIFIIITLILLAMWFIPSIPINFIGSLIVIIFGFFFATVSSRMVGLVGTSNNPASGMTIATVIITAFILKSMGNSDSSGMISTISIGAIICIIAAIAGDTSQDLKTGYILGASPKKQQIGEMIGIFVSSLSIGGVLILLNKAYGFGTQELAAPQATLMKMVIEGVMGGNLPWTLIFTGAFIAIVIEIMGLPVLAVAIGLYLPLELSTTMMIGGVIRYFVDKKRDSNISDTDKGLLFSSGMIAGEGLVGIILAILTVCNVTKYFDLSRFFTTGTIGGAIMIFIVTGILVLYSREKKVSK